MCGIAGFFHWNGKWSPPKWLEQAASLQTHRGPDHTGFYQDEHAGLAHNRLSLLDLSERGHQPFGEDGRMLVYNGEIYNFQQLRRQLEEKGVRFRSTSDTEVLYRHLLEYGVSQTLQAIQGMFAFAFWDRHTQRLVLARDRVGIKPLFYAEKNGTVFFASELKALSHTLPLTLDEPRLLYSTLGILEKSRYETVFKEAVHVTPGTWVEFSPAGKKTHTYCRLDDFISPEQYQRRRKAGFKAALEELDGLMASVVKKMLISDAPMGAYVSGGIDSSLITVYADRYADSDFKLFTANVLGKYSEFEDAQRLAGAVKRPLFDYPFRPEYFIRDFAKVTWHYESPVVVHTNAVPFSNVSAMARSEQVKAVLTGEGSDELFLGYPRLLTRRYNALIRLPFTLLNKLYALFPPLKSYIQGGGAAGMEVLFEKMLYNFTRDLLRQEGMAKLDFLPPNKRQEHYLTLQMLREGIVSLLWRNDRMGMIHSIEARFPFLDESILEFAINLPSEYKIGRIRRFYNYKHPFLIDKKIVRRLAAKYLPDSLIYKKKMGFPMFGLHYVQADESFFKNGFVSETFRLKPDEMEFLRTRFPRYHVAKFIALETWGRLFVRQDPIEDIAGHLERHLSITV